MLPLTGEIEIELTLAALMPSDVPLVTPSKLARIVTVPSERAVARPLTVIEAKLEFDDCHCTTLVMSWVVLSENVPMAVYCWLSPKVKLEFAGVTAICATVAGVTVSTLLPLTEPRAAL